MSFEGICVVELRWTSLNASFLPINAIHELNCCHLLNLYFIVETSLKTFDYFGFHWYKFMRLLMHCEVWLT